MKTLKLLFSFALILNFNAKGQTPFVIGLTIDEISNTVKENPSFKITEDLHKEKSRKLSLETDYFFIDFFAIGDTTMCNSISYIFKENKDIGPTIEYFDNILGKNISNTWHYTNSNSKVKIDGVFYDYNCSKAIIFYGYSF